LTGREIEQAFGSCFSEFRYVEKQFLESSLSKRGDQLARMARFFPGLYLLYRTWWQRVILARK
jgi:hypothetical protein